MILAAAGAAAFGLAACGTPGSPQIASLGNGGGSASTTPRTGTSLRETGGSDGGTSATSVGKSDGTSGGSSATTLAKGNATALLDEWTTCIRGQGDPDQADPVVDAYGVINITIPTGASEALSGQVHDVTGPCSQYLAAAQSALRAANPVPPPPDQAQLTKYVECMRASGVPNYPFATDGRTDFNGTGVDPNSPSVEKATKACGQKLGFPAWWIAGTGPPGDVVVTSIGPGGSPPPGGAGNGGTRPVPTGSGASGANGVPTTNG